MKPGSAIIDVSIDQGGCVETSRPTTLAEPTFVYKGVTHFCVPNFTADLGRSAAWPSRRPCCPTCWNSRRHGVERAVESCSELARGVYTLTAARAGEASMTNDYRSRIMTADEALAEVQSGQRVYIHNGCAEPIELVQALTRRGPELRDVEVLHMATMGIADYSLPRVRRPLPHQRPVHRRQRAPGRAGRPRRLHPHLPERDRRPVHAPAPCPSTCACCNARRPTTTAT